jgi:hypothetical protein
MGRSIVRSQLNDVVRAIVSSGIDRNDFSIHPAITQSVLAVELPMKITFGESSFFFELYDYGGELRVNLFPTAELTKKGAITCPTFDAVIERLNEWLEIVRSQTEQPDPWVLLTEGSVLTSNIPISSGNDKVLNDNELAGVREHLAAIRQFLISELSPNADQMKLIEEKLSYLEASARRQTKQDWAHTAIGVVFSIAVGVALAPDQANRLFLMTSEFLQTLFVKLIA